MTSELGSKWYFVGRNVRAQGGARGKSSVSATLVSKTTVQPQCKPPYVWTDTVQGRHSTVWSGRLALPYGTEAWEVSLKSPNLRGLALSLEHYISLDEIVRKKGKRKSKRDYTYRYFARRLKQWLHCSPKM